MQCCLHCVGNNMICDWFTVEISGKCFNDVINWIFENIGHNYDNNIRWQYRKSLMYLKFDFINQEDAVLFALRWK